MRFEKAKQQAILYFRIDTGYSGSEDDLDIITHSKYSLFSKATYRFTITVILSGDEMSISYAIEGESLLKEPNVRIYLFIYTLLTVMFCLGIVNNWRFYELTFFSPIVFGYLYFRCCYPYLKDLLKKQADAVSFFLAMFTASSLQFKLIGIEVTLFPSLNNTVRLVLCFLSLYVFCTFISVKFYISLRDFLHSINIKKHPNVEKFIKYFP
ncbi:MULTISPECIES: hypothetical protein [Pantoea]|uniref:hypothetical protein n=1 Tax=Pantoea TaxID=53335 RepID=UPI003C7CE386